MSKFHDRVILKLEEHGKKVQERPEPDDEQQLAKFLQRALRVRKEEAKKHAL